VSTRTRFFFQLHGKTHQSKPREDEIEGLVDKLEVDHKFAPKAVRRAIYVMELDRTVYRGEERAIEPPAALGDQLGNLKPEKDQIDSSVPKVDINMRT
jgi:hypothetical protein